MKLMPLLRETTSNTVRRFASRKSNVIGRVSAKAVLEARSCAWRWSTSIVFQRLLDHAQCRVGSLLCEQLLRVTQGSKLPTLQPEFDQQRVDPAVLRVQCLRALQFLLCFVVLARDSQRLGVGHHARDRACSGADLPGPQERAFGVLLEAFIEDSKRLFVFASSKIQLRLLTDALLGTANKQRQSHCSWHPAPQRYEKGGLELQRRHR
jgi:hypothetical protein